MSAETEAVLEQYGNGEITEAERDDEINAIAARGRSILTALDSNRL